MIFCSAECAEHLVDANVNMKNAKSELEAAYAAQRSKPSRNLPTIKEKYEL